MCLRLQRRRLTRPRNATAWQAATRLNQRETRIRLLSGQVVRWADRGFTLRQRAEFSAFVVAAILSFCASARASF
jgi:hypothetical protein